MRYHPATYVRGPPWANTVGPAAHQPASTPRSGDRDGAMRREAAELDVWEDEGGTLTGHAPESPGRPVGRHFDEFSG